MDRPTYFTVVEKTVPMAPFAKARPRVPDGRKAYMPKDYKRQCRQLNMLFGGFDIPDLVRLTVVAVRPIPKSWSKKKRQAHLGQYATPTPDIDNIIGAVMDSLLAKDNLVVETAGKKIWGPEGALHIKIEGIAYE